MAFGATTQALLIIAAGIVLALIARAIILRLGHLIISALGLSQWESGTIRVLGWLAPIWLVVFAAYLAAHRFPLTAVQRWWVDRVTAAIVIIVIAEIIRRLVSAVLSHYTRRATRRGATASTLNLLRKIVQVIVFTIAVLLILEQFNYRFTAVLAGLGLVSLGIGLALQDTLSNFFAGLWLSVDRPVSRGDYVELDSGHAGWIMEVGWRFSRLATWDENFLIVPNSRLASATFINNTGPSRETSLYIHCRASYNSDLDAVEKAALSAARQTVERVEGVVKDFEPVVLFRAFDDFYIRYSVGFHVQTQEARRLAISEFIRALKRNSDEAGLQVPYSITKVHLQDERTQVEPQSKE
ncbi:MAG: mechanosensitive ion channel family protein [Armatimonadota bacterium]